MRNEQGVALLTVLMVVVVLMLLGMTLIQFNTIEATQVHRQANQLQAHYLARSGLNVAINYLDEQAGNYATMDDLKLEPSFQGSLPGVGKYEVELAKVGDDQVRLSSRGIVEGKNKAEDTIVLDLRIESIPSSFDYAQPTNWYKNANQTVRILVHSTKEDPLTSPDPVHVDARNKILAQNGDYHLKAPAMQFLGNADTDLQINNPARLYLYSDYLYFGSVVDSKGTLSLNVGENPIIMDGKKYGVVYFANNEHSSLAGVTKGRYYLFEDGTTWSGRNMTRGSLRDAQDHGFTFDDHNGEGAISIVTGSFVYSSGSNSGRK